MKHYTTYNVLQNELYKFNDKYPHLKPKYLFLNNQTAENLWRELEYNTKIVFVNLTGSLEKINLFGYEITVHICNDMDNNKITLS